MLGVCFFAILHPPSSPIPHSALPLAVREHPLPSRRRLFASKGDFSAESDRQNATYSVFSTLSSGSKTTPVASRIQWYGISVPKGRAWPVRKHLCRAHFNSEFLELLTPEFSGW